MQYGKPICLWRENKLVNQGLYIDDNAISGVVSELEAMECLPSHDIVRADACDQAYHNQGWAPKLKKRVGHLVEGGCAWGAEIHGSHYAWVGDKRSRRWSTACAPISAALQPTVIR